ncbi:neuropeptide SIFamide-like [Tachypleus tridentatus]|uniref:neuropeptide SIFamide-like n=1 Tax=Tachypleus tridentatus TaxID=6853 RepID=UPI003FD59D71
MDFTTTMLIFLITTFLINSIDASFKRPLFNGSVFGKRSEVEYQNGNIWRKGFDGASIETEVQYVICKAVWETCTRWFSSYIETVKK